MNVNDTLPSFRIFDDDAENAEFARGDKVVKLMSSPTRTRKRTEDQRRGRVHTYYGVRRK